MSYSFTTLRKTYGEVQSCPSIRSKFNTSTIGALASLVISTPTYKAGGEGIDSWEV